MSAVLKSNKVNYWTGHHVKAFETEFAEFTDTRYAIALANGTLALEAALMALNIGPGDEVIVTPRSFMASVSAVVSVGATPVFADVDTESQAISADSIRPCLSERTKGVILVHLGGYPADVESVLNLLKPLDIHLIEDCAQAHGAKISGRSVGSFGDIAAWSFCQDKIMSTGGEGGMITTNNEALWTTIFSLKDHGKNPDKVRGKSSDRHTFQWLIDSFGSNWRMTEMQAVLGRIQLKRLPRWQRARYEIASAIWNSALAYQWLRVPVLASTREHACYKAYLFVVPEAMSAGWTRDKVLAELNEFAIPAGPGSCPEIYREKAFDNTGWQPRHRLPNAKKLGETSIAIPLNPNLQSEDVNRVSAALASVNEKMASTAVCL